MAAVQISIYDNDTVISWQSIGQCEGLESDDHIANFLIKLYLKLSQDIKEDGHCKHCNCMLFLRSQLLPSGTLEKETRENFVASGVSVNNHVLACEQHCQQSDCEDVDHVSDTISCAKVVDGDFNNSLKPESSVPFKTLSDVLSIRQKLLEKTMTSDGMMLNVGVKVEEHNTAFFPDHPHVWTNTCRKKLGLLSLPNRAETSNLGSGKIPEVNYHSYTDGHNLFGGESSLKMQNIPSCLIIPTDDASLKNQAEKENIQNSITNDEMDSNIHLADEPVEQDSQSMDRADSADIFKRDDTEEDCGSTEDAEMIRNLCCNDTKNKTFSQIELSRADKEDTVSKDEQLMLAQDRETEQCYSKSKRRSGCIETKKRTKCKSEKAKAQDMKGSKIFSWHKSGSISPHRKNDLKKRKPFTSFAQSAVSSFNSTKMSEDPLACPVCKKRFSHKKTLRCHMFIHTGEKPYVCSVCNAQFRQSSNLQNHLKTVHTAEKQIICAHCPFACKTNKSLKQHILLRHSGPLERTFQCSQCSASFVSRSHLQRHELTHSGEKPYVCGDCGQAFSQKCNLKKHVASAHRKTLDGSPIKCASKFMCDVCGKTFFAGTSLIQHKVRHSTARPYKCDLCSKSFKTKPVLKQHHRNLHSVSGPFSCNACEKSFGTKAALNSHMKIHSANRTFICETCGKSFRTQLRLICHKATHSESRPVSCDICEKSFKTQFTLNQHRQRHIANTEFLCETCGKAFKTRRSLRLHEATHSDSRIHSCSMCDKSFKTKIALYSHKVSHSVSKNFVCETCGKTFKRRCELKKHETRHSEMRPHSCEVCDKSFKTKYCLHSHRLTHSLGKDFVCTTCGKVYKSRPSLSNHEATHSDTRPHTCEICEKSFISSPSLKRHMSLHSHTR